MKRNFVLASAMALAITGGSVGIAHAQERQPVKIDVAKACGAVTLTFVNPNTDVNKTAVFTWNAVAGNEVTSVGKRTGDVTVPPAKTVKETIRFTEDEFNGTGAVTVNPVAGPDSDIQPRLDIYPVDTDCAPPVVTPPAPKDEFDCPDFPLDDGTTAQQFLDKDKSDPSRLDSDKDGKACELGDDGFVPPTTQNPPPPASTTVPPPAPTTQNPPPAVVNNNTNVNNAPPAANSPQVQRVPVGGVETGDGSLA
jgi:hypothetical protein